MPRYALALEYNGADFSGWQSQPHARNVQDCVQAALSRVADHNIAVICAGRTDAGVHAYEQVIHFDSTAKRTINEWQRGSNSHLPDDVTSRWVCPVSDDFHARFSAQRRYYTYRILNRSQPPALYKGLLSWVYTELDVDAMHQAAQLLVGEHDFSSFRAAGCQAHHAVRRIFSISVQRCGHELIEVQLCANAFLQHMVRTIVGVLLAVGRGDQAPAWVAEVLACCDRRQGGVTAEPAGLYFLGADYSPHFALPNRDTAGRLRVHTRCSGQVATDTGLRIL